MKTFAPQQKPIAALAQRLWSPPTAGLAFGDRRGWIVVGRDRGQACEIERAGKFSWQTSFAEDPQPAIQAAANWLRTETGFDPGELVVSLPATCLEYESVELELELNPQDEAQQQTIAQQLMKEILAENYSQAAYDFWPHQLGSTTAMNLAWTTRETTIQIGQELTRFGWQVAALDIQAASLARIGKWSVTTEPALVVDVTPTTATFVWCSDSNPQFVRNGISFSNHSPVELVAQRRGVSLLTAETMLTRWGLRNSSGDLPLAELHAACLSDWLERLGYEIQRTVQFLRGQFSLALAPQVVLCGEGATIAGLPEWLSEHLGFAVATPGLPTSVSWLSAEPYDPSYAVALSNALYGRTP